MAQASVTPFNIRMTPTSTVAPPRLTWTSRSAYPERETAITCGGAAVSNAKTPVRSVTASCVPSTLATTASASLRRTSRGSDLPDDAQRARQREQSQILRFRAVDAQPRIDQRLMVRRPERQFV